MSNYKYIPKPNDQREDIRAAKELYYPKYVIEMLEKEPDPDKRQRILHDARKRILK